MGALCRVKGKEMGGVEKRIKMATVKIQPTAEIFGGGMKRVVQQHSAQGSFDSGYIRRNCLDHRLNSGS